MPFHELGKRLDEQLETIQSASSTPEVVKATIKGFSDKGVDELCLIDLGRCLADLVASSAS